MASMETIDRDSLYEEIWSTPMIDLGAKYGVSRNAIKWACAQLRVPLPPQGYWAARAAGRPMQRLPLPAPLRGQTTTINRAELAKQDAPRPRQSQKREFSRKPLVERVFGGNSRTEAAPAIVSTIIPPDYKWQPAIQKIKRDLEARAKDARAMKKRYDWEQDHPGKVYPFQDAPYHRWEGFTDSGGILGPAHGRLAVRVTLDTYERGLLLLNEIFAKAEEANFSIEVGKGGAHIKLLRAGAAVELRVVEKLRVGSRDRVNSYTKKVERERIMLPTGRLEMIVAQQGGGATVFKENPGTGFDGQQAKIAEAIEHRYSGSQIVVAEWAKREQLWRETEIQRRRDEQFRAEQRKRAEEEKQRRDMLVQEVERWERAESIRRYLFELDRRTAAGGTPMNDYAEWRQWATEVADDLDESRVRVTPDAGG